VINGTMANYSITGFADGLHYWNISSCNDSALNKNTTGSELRHFTVDTVNPTASVGFSATSLSPLGSVTITCGATDATDPVPTAALTSVRLPNNVLSSDLDGTFGDTLTEGAYTVICTATDSSGRTGSATSTFTVSSGAVSGGSSSSTVTARTPSVSTTLSAIKPEAPAVVKVANAKIAVTEIKLEVKEEASNVKVSVEAITAPPSGTSAPEGKVYKYLDIKKENLADENLKSAKISFFVERTWLAENGVAPANIVLKRFAAAWEELPTKVLTSDEDKFYFEADTPGFSVFAIGVKAAAAAAQVEEEAEEAPSEEAPAEEAAPAAPAEPAKKSLAWLYVLLAVVVIGAVVAVVLLKKKK
ncbi:MAG: PGF-pre-PGF domain-containing protein, partial [Nanoarchaeota archaeon]|nr:PGF-pre-PGF domain-containing protein [Nanoarchaeota archaeon]